MIRIKPLFLGLSLILLGCIDQSYEETRELRTQAANISKDGDPIVIGISWRTADSDLFINGVKLAVDEINKKGGVLNSPLKIIINDTESAFSDSTLSVENRQNAILKIANSFAANPKITAVIGHSSSSIATLASVVYQNNGVLFLAANATNAKLTGHNFAYTFRAIPTNEETGVHLADYAAQQGYKNIAMLHGRGDYETELANAFSTNLLDRNKDDTSKKDRFNIVYRRSFFNSTVNIISLITDLKNLRDLDAIFIASNSTISAKVYQQSRNMGVKLPIIGGETFDTKGFLDQVKQWEDVKDIQKSGIPTVFNASAPANQKFITQFKKAYGDDVNPDYLAALGYDTVNLVAHAIQLAQSRIPIEIAVTLRYMEACKGVAGKYQFKPNGDLKSKPLYVKRWTGGKFVYEEIKQPAKKDENGVLIIETNKAADEAGMETCNDIDRDKDTIPNNADACASSTPTEIASGIILEGAFKGCPLDDDEDGIPNYKDSCLGNTKTEIAHGVNSQGCPTDMDADGRPDYQDTDIDGDAVANNLDKCPKNTHEEISKGINLKGLKTGCPVDGDADLVPSYRDSCPKNTAVEISQGVDIKGCPADNDRDGVFNYQDKCPQTPVDVLTDKEGCEILATTTSQQPTTLFFAAKQLDLTDAGKSYLDDLLTHSNPALLKTIQITGYTFLNKVVFQSRLQAIGNYLQQKGVPAEKIDTLMSTQKNGIIELTFSQLQSKSTGSEKTPQSADAEKQVESTTVKTEKTAEPAETKNKETPSMSAPTSKPAGIENSLKPVAAEAKAEPAAASNYKAQPAGVVNNPKPVADKNSQPPVVENNAKPELAVPPSLPPR